MEVSINQSVFKLFGLMPMVAPGDCIWKSLLNRAYSLSLILFLIAQNVMIYEMHSEQDFAVLFIRTILLLTSLVILAQALLSAKGLQFLLDELEEIDRTTRPCWLASYTDRRSRYSAMFYTTYLLGISRGVYRTLLMVDLKMRPAWIALQPLIPSLILLARINQQVHLMELFGYQMELLVAELDAVFDDDYGDDGHQVGTDEDARCRVGRILQRMENIFGRLQKCLILMNDLFGWSTAAMVIFVFVNITFQFRTPMKPFPVHGKASVEYTSDRGCYSVLIVLTAQLVDIFYTIMCLFFLCRASSSTTTKVHEMCRLLLKPSYHDTLWEQVHNFIVRIKLQPFEFTANGLYPINYGLFSSTVAASATYIVIMFQFDQKVPGM